MEQVDDDCLRNSVFPRFDVTTLGLRGGASFPTTVGVTMCLTFDAFVSNRPAGKGVFSGVDGDFYSCVFGDLVSRDKVGRGYCVHQVCKDGLYHGEFYRDLRVLVIPSGIDFAVRFHSGAGFAIF